MAKFPVPSRVGDLLRGDAGGGILLLVAAAFGMAAANSPAANGYFDGLHAYLGPLSLLHWINDGLMAVFFLLAGLEIRREFVMGRLSSWGDRRLPILAAVGGMLVPALIYLFVVRGDAGLTQGWAIPSATDIAFAVGALALLGSRVPVSLKLFLLTVAIVDDLGAIVIIAVAYTDQVALRPLLFAGVVLWAMWWLGRRGEQRLGVFLALAALVWIGVYRSGVHATIAGVLAAMMIPIHATGDDGAVLPSSPLHRLEHALVPWVRFAVLPLFGFANAGVALAGTGLNTLGDPVPMGVALGLFLGKQAGIFAAVWLAVKLGWGFRPRGATWLQVYGVALLCGIGFTMSLFIGGLAFEDPLLVDEVKIGVLLGSLLSATAGMLVLRYARPLRND